MEQGMKNKIAESIRDFKLPEYDSIPNVGLYLEQATKYITEYLMPLESITITSSMISNYVKKKLIDSPVKKQYNREQIAYLFFIAVAKTVLSLENIQLLFEMQKRTYSSRKAYEYFCEEFENVLYYVFGLKDTLEEVGKSQTHEKTMLRNTIIAVSHKIYLDKYLSALQGKD